MKNFFIYFNQLVVWVLVHILGIYYKINVIDKDLTIDNKHKYLIIANHRNKLDPFIIASYIPIKLQFRLIPYRFLTTNEYMKNVPINWFLYWCGCFSIDNSLKKAQKFIKRNETVFIFPEGKLNTLGKFNNSIKLGIGAIYLERTNPDLYLVPVKIEYTGKRKIKIIYKKPFRHKRFQKDLYPLMEKAMKNIYEGPK